MKTHTKKFKLQMVEIPTLSGTTIWAINRTVFHSLNMWIPRYLFHPKGMDEISCKRRMDFSMWISDIWRVERGIRISYHKKCIATRLPSQRFPYLLGLKTTSRPFDDCLFVRSQFSRPSPHHMYVELSRYWVLVQHQPLPPSRTTATATWTQWQQQFHRCPQLRQQWS